jgi:hypothetical protein
MKGVYQKMLKRTRNIVIGAVMTGVTGIGVAATLPANAAENNYGTWALAVKITDDRQGPEAITIRWLDPHGKDTSACYPLRSGEARVLNQSGVLGAAAQVSLFLVPDCSDGSFAEPVNFASPSIRGEVVSVTFDRAGGHLG